MSLRILARPALAVALSMALSAPTCDRPPVVHNTAPTVTIVAGPSDAIATDTARFAWTGQDLDGNLTGFYFGVDDSIPGTWTKETAFTVAGLALGPHAFQVVAEDDSGARSMAASRSFWVEYDSSLVPRGTDTTLEIVSWNIQNFPKDDDTTINRVRAVIAGLDLDIYGVQEIEDTIAFQRLVAGLPDYDGLYSRDDYGSFYQKTGVIYRRGMVTVSDVGQLFRRNDSVTRPPLEMTANATRSGRSFDFRLVVLHLKAGSTFEDQAERRATCRLLKEYIDSEMEQGQDRFVVVGDWNDRLDDARQSNVFQQFLDDSLNYRFLTWPMRSSSQSASHIGSRSLIDHIMVTAGVFDEYEGGVTATVRLDDEILRYEQVISDHRPVASWFPVFAP